MRRLFLFCMSTFLLSGCGHAATNLQSQAVASPGTSVAGMLSDVPGPTPTPVPTATLATPQPEPVAQSGPTNLRPPTNPPPPPPASPRWRIIGPGVNIGIGGSVSNCSATFRPVPSGAAYFDSCQPGLWFDCHIGTCPAMNGWGVGSVVNYYDGNGTQHTYTIQYVQSGTAGKPMSVYGSVHFQVCQQNVPNAPVLVVSA